MAEWKQPPKLRDDLEVSEQEAEGQKYYILKDPVTFRYFRLREPEYFLVRQFDGVTVFDTVSARFRDKFNLNVSAEAVGQFAHKIDELFFFEGRRAEYEISSGRYLGRTKKSLFSKILFVKLKAFNPQRLLTTILPAIRFAFHPISLILMIIVILGGFATYSANFEYFKFDPKELYSIGAIVVILLSVTLIILLHEMAHALTCARLGGQVREMGFLLLYFQICFYTNLSDSWMFSKKSHRLAVIWAGIFFQMVLFALAVFGWRVTVIGTGVNQFFWISANIALLTLLFNFNPLIKLDGYYFLSEWLGVPNLRLKSFQYVRHILKRAIGVESHLPPASGRERRIYICYTLFAGLYSILLIGFIAYIVYRFLVDILGGFGFILFLILLALIFNGPVVQGIRFIGSREVMKALFSRPRNLIITGSIIAVLVILLFIIPFPRRVGGDVVVRPVAEYTITLYSGQGLLEAKFREGGLTRQFTTEHIQLSTGDLSVLRLTPLVREGDIIGKGDTLAAIASTQVSSSLEAAQAELNRLRGELALAQSPPKREEIATAQAAVNAARATVEQLQKDVERNNSLYEKKLISKQELEKSESQLNVAHSNLEESEAKLSLLKSPPKPEEVDIISSKIVSQEATISLLMSQEAAQVIASPIDGTVTVLFRDDLLFKISDMSAVEVAIPVTDNYLEYVEPNASVYMKVRTFPERVFEGTVSHIANSADEGDYNDNRARFFIHAVIDNDDNSLRDGMSGYAKIACGASSLFTIIMDRIRAFVRVEFWSWW